ncbi:MAG: hypothetical protein A2X67_05965 [Ignavibacteria bacterium GWA2_55_11]|nr:MAG: hypothetical protein A2X67_05965 [Ignavibacteria bacterium GWA2_55_11]OGU70869.1 MAG: hypothetical protein A3G43_02750 [Ignavibacteria bacterium RIFCSPLOWO2_12_FULL_56_21]
MALRASHNAPVSTLSISVARLAEGEHHYTFTAGTSDIGLGAEFQGPITVDVDLSRQGRQFYLDAAFSTNARFVCDRCLDEFSHVIDGTYSMLYVPEGTLADGDGNEEGQEIQEIPADAQLIHLDDDVRQFVLLSVPGKLLCRDECRGLCPVCGKNRNHFDCACTETIRDTRWDALKKLNKK